MQVRPSHTSDLKTGIVLATLQDAGQYARTVLSGVISLRLDEITGLISSFCLGVAAR